MATGQLRPREREREREEREEKSKGALGDGVFVVMSLDTLILLFLYWMEKCPNYNKNLLGQWWCWLSARLQSSIHN